MYCCVIGMKLFRILFRIVVLMFIVMNSVKKKRVCSERWAYFLKRKKKKKNNGLVFLSGMDLYGLSLFSIFGMKISTTNFPFFSLSFFNLLLVQSASDDDKRGRRRMKKNTWISCCRREKTAKAAMYVYTMAFISKQEPSLVTSAEITLTSFLVMMAEETRHVYFILDLFWVEIVLPSLVFSCFCFGLIIFFRNPFLCTNH